MFYIINFKFNHGFTNTGLPVLTAKAIASARFINGLNVNGIMPPLYFYFQLHTYIGTLHLLSFFWGHVRTEFVKHGSLMLQR